MKRQIRVDTIDRIYSLYFENDKVFETIEFNWDRMCKIMMLYEQLRTVVIVGRNG